MVQPTWTFRPDVTDSRTVNASVPVPPVPSGALASSTETTGSPSSLRMVPTPSERPRVAPDGVRRRTAKVSSASGFASPRTVTPTVTAGTFAGIVTVVEMPE